VGFGFLTYFFFPAQLCFFIAGMLLHRLYAVNSFGKLDRRIGYGVLTVVVALLVFFDRLPKPIAVYLVCASCILAIPILFDLTRKSRFDVALGNLSYPVYIVHTLIISIVVNVVHHTNLKINEDIIGFTVIVAVLIVSMLLYLAVEKPIDAIRQRRAVSIKVSAQGEALANNMGAQP
jgi:peptidoglycan/LPS O-acetylase OafA/YrhL